MPGLERLVVNMVTAAPMGESDIYMIAEMHFPDRQTFDQAMASAENRAAGKDLVAFVAGKVSVVFAEEQ